MYKETEDLVRTVKQATEERYMRSQLLDAQHVTASKKLKKLVNSCKLLKKEIQQREELRFKLNGLMMELSNALEEDLKSALEVCENEATKPVSVTVSDLRRAVETGVLHPGGSNSNSKGTAFTFDQGGVVKDGEAAKAKGSKGTNVSTSKSIQSKTEKNTLLNGVSKLPLLVQRTDASSSANVNIGMHESHLSNSISNSSESHAQGEESSNSSTAPSRDKLFNNVYAQLPQYDAAAIAYVRSFDAPKSGKVWKWCKQSAPEVTKSVQGMYPAVKGPVELIQAEPGAPGSPPRSPKKSPTGPSFRRRAGHSSKNSLAGSISVNVNYFARDRHQSVGAAGMPSEWLSSLSRDKPGSPTESAEDARRRALKFMLNERETHYDLLSREVVDAVTMLQMEQARAIAAAKRKRDAELANPHAAASALAQELDVHQYRTHQLLTSDYSGKAGDYSSGMESVGEEYSLYVSLPEMSAHSALTARQAVRCMQGTSASISLQTVSKVIYF